MASRKKAQVSTLFVHEVPPTKDVFRRVPLLDSKKFNSVLSVLN
jgi:hypothetical protein